MYIKGDRIFDLLLIGDSYILAKWLKNEFFLISIFIEKQLYSVENRIKESIGKDGHDEMLILGHERPVYNIEDIKKPTLLGRIEIREVGRERLQVVGYSLYPELNDAFVMLHQEILKIWKTDPSEVQKSGKDMNESTSRINEKHHHLLEKKAQEGKTSQIDHGKINDIKLISDPVLMKQYYKGYSVVTAREILEAIPDAWIIYHKLGGRWGPGIIARCYSLGATTIGRYMSAFKKAGFNEIIYKGKTIPIP